MWVQFKRSDKDTPLLICILYRNPASPYAWYDDFVRMMDVVSDRHPKANLLMLGDFNIDLLKPQISWISTFSLYGLKQLVSQPTRLTPTSSTLLDHIYSNNPSYISGVHLSDVSISDHNPIVCTWSCKLPKMSKSHVTIQYRCFRHFNKDLFLFDLSCNNFANIYNCTNANDALSLWYNVFMPIVDKHAPLRRRRVKRQTVPGWLTADLVNAMKLRDKLKKEKNFVEYKKQRNRVSQMVKDAKQVHLEKLIGDNCDTVHIWRAINEITQKSKRSSPSENITISPDEFNKHFLSVINFVNPPTASEKGDDQPSPLLQQFCDQRVKPGDSFQLPQIAVHEVGKYIEGLKNKKSMGLDSLNSFLLKLALPYVVESLTFIYNLCIESNTFPDDWKTAKVVPLPKSNDTSDVNNFRPISILSVLSKPLERHIHKHLTTYIEDRRLYFDFQSGFRKNHSCNTALTRMCDVWLSAINRCEIIGAVFLDFKKAFDLVDHSVLLKKLLVYTQSASIVSFIQSFLTNRSQCVVVNATYSSQEHVPCGVPQGSILGPLLFGLFINDLPLFLKNDKVVCDLFADDGTLHTASSNVATLESTLQCELDNVLQWCSQNKMVVNSQKTKSMLIASRQKHQRAPLSINLSFNNDTIEQVHSHKVLGVTIDDEMRWHLHINNVCKSVAKNIYLLGKLKHYLITDALKSFFYAHCLSHINYASNVWCHAGEVHLKKLNSLHRRAAKIIVPNPYLSTEEKLRFANILPMDKQFDFNTAVMVFKARQGLAPAYLKNLLTNGSNRSSSGNYLLPQTRIDLYKSSFAFYGAKVWNSLPAKAKGCRTLTSFKTSIRKYFLN
jgi:hypothetical protein